MLMKGVRYAVFYVQMTSVLADVDVIVHRGLIDTHQDAVRQVFVVVTSTIRCLDI